MLMDMYKTMSYFKMDIHPLTISSVWFISTKYFILSKFYPGEGGMIYLYHGLSACTEDDPRSTQFVDYLLVQVDKPWYNYYLLAYAYKHVQNNAFISGWIFVLLPSVLYGGF